MRTQATPAETQHLATRYRITVVGRAAAALSDAALERYIERCEELVGAGPIHDREAWDAAQAELARGIRLARATLDYSRRVRAIAKGEEA